MKQVVAIGWLIIISTAVFAGDLTVIYDSGDTLSIKRYLDKRVVNEPGNLSSLDKNNESFPKFPIFTIGMTPGKVVARQHNIPHLQTPLFLIGSDSFSISWLESRHQELLNIGAIGLLLQAEDIRDFERIQKIGNGLKIIPASARDISKQLSLQHYPALISRYGIEQ